MAADEIILGGLASESENRSDEEGTLHRSPYLNQSDAFLKECIERCANTGYPEHATRAFITLISFVGSALFFFGVKAFIEETLGDDQVFTDLGDILGLIGLIESALPLAGLGVTTAEDMKSSSKLEQEFLELTPRGKVEYVLRAIAGLMSAVPIGGLSYYVLVNFNALIKWGGTITGFLGLAFGTVPSMLKMGKSAPNRLEAREGKLSAAQLSVLDRMHKNMLARIQANQHKIAQVAHSDIPKNSRELLRLSLKDPAPSYGRGLDIVVIGGTGVSITGMTGYAVSTGLFVNPLFRSLPNIPSVLADDVTTGCFILAFGNLMRLSCKGGFSDLYRLGVAIHSAWTTGSIDGLRDFMKNEIYASRFFPVAAPAIAGILAVLGSSTGFTNGRACYVLTLALLNAITFGNWGKWGLNTTTEVLRWVTAVCGFINSDFFNGRGSIIAVLNVFLLRYGHLFLKDQELKEVLKNFNGSQLYLRRFGEDLPVDKSLSLLNDCGSDIVESVLTEVTKDESAPSITMENWGEVVTAIEEQRSSHTVTEDERRDSNTVTESSPVVRLSSNIFSFSRSTRQNYQNTSLRNDECAPELLLIQPESEQQSRYGSFYRDEENPSARVNGLEKSASFCAVM